MDKLIKRWDAERDDDLMLCEKHGVAYQRDMRIRRVTYDSGYLAKVAAYEGTKIAEAVNQGRCNFVAQYLSIKQTASSKASTLLDLGAGTGAFVCKIKVLGYDAKGFEVIPESAAALTAQGLFNDGDAGFFDAVTAWDSIEHMDNPANRLNNMRKGSLLFVSIPVFQDLRKIRASKHYRPGEHLYYWTKEGFVEWMGLYGFRLLEESKHEVDAGRESIGAFAFRRELPDYNDHISAYDYMHSHSHYGDSSSELFLDEIASVVREYAPTSILDFGCGRSDLVSHFWLDGARKIARYDPAIPRWKTMPEGEFSLVLCCDVMEHIPMASVDRILLEVRAKGDAALFTISTKLARSKLPDGRNAHVTLLSKDEWLRWITDVFGTAYLLPSKWEHEIIVCAGMGAKATASVVPACSECGGEMYLDSFLPPRRDATMEWFMRCRKCEARGPAASREADARQQWYKEAKCVPAP